MSRIILVHGAWGDAHSWDSVAPLLRARGHEVTAVTLPGHGDGRDPGTVGMADYIAHVADIATQGDPALLVGHSMGGVVISGAAEAVPDAVRKLVYVAALLPRSGESLLSLIKQQEGPGVANAVRPAPMKGATTLDAEAAADTLFQDATPAQRATVQFTTQPNRGQIEPVTLGGNFARVPRAYLFCTEDRTVTYPLQRAMEAASPCAESFTLEGCGHVPQLTRADEVATILDQL